MNKFVLVHSFGMQMVEFFENSYQRSQVIHHVGDDYDDDDNDYDDEDDDVDDDDDDDDDHDDDDEQ